MVVWITGLSGSGKTILCQALWRFLKPRMPELVIIDGDMVRAAFGNDLGYHEKDRVIQIKRIQNIAQLLSQQGLVVLVAALYSNADLLRWNRTNFSHYFEVYLEASLECVRKRDPKGLHAQAAAGEISHVVGVDIPWHVPARPDLVIDVDSAETPDRLARTVINAIPSFRSIFGVE